jgi:hypothetical protein
MAYSRSRVEPQRLLVFLFTYQTIILAPGRPVADLR